VHYVTALAIFAFALPVGVIVFAYWSIASHVCRAAASANSLRSSPRALAITVVKRRAHVAKVYRSRAKASAPRRSSTSAAVVAAANAGTATPQNVGRLLQTAFLKR